MGDHQQGRLKRPPPPPVTINSPKHALDEKWGLQRFWQCILGLLNTEKAGIRAVHYQCHEAKLIPDYRPSSAPELG